MRDPLAPIIEGFDLSGIVNRWSFECEPFFTDASDSQTMLDGSTIHDVFPVKVRFSWTLNSMSVEQYAALNAAMDSGAARDTVAAQIFDPTINAVRSARFHVTRPVFAYSFTTRRHMSTAGSVLTLEDAAPRTLSAVTPAPRQAAAPRDPLAPVVEGFDLSGIVNRWSFQCEPFQTEGDNGGTCLDGSTVRDVLADKVRLSWRLNAISAQRYADLCAVLGSGSEPDTVSAIVFNPATNTRYTTTFHVTFPVFRFAFDTGQCMAFADSALVLEETGYGAEVIASGDWWRLESDGTLYIYCIGDMPSREWKDYKSNIAAVDIASSVTSIGYMAFEECRNLTSITIPDSVTSIENYAFDRCSALTSITIPNSVTSIGERAFEGCWGLTSVTIPDGVTSIRSNVFYSCIHLTSITIPSSVTSIGYMAFAECSALTSITIPNSVTSIRNHAFKRCIYLTSITIPGSVTSIGEYAFVDCWGLTSVTISQGITSIENCAFTSCISLTSVTIPGSVTSIGYGTFSECSALTSVTILSSVPNIGNSTFIGCSALTSITIPGSVTSIGDYAFFECDALTDVYYGGTEAQWNTITIGSYNTPLTRATIHYNSSPT